ncbi:uncharacterized protein LOC110715191 [Chenopodium quinoa]|uniref:uncharacterized protein LOC110715191 n=1 Tax=Chenopodium quinoa TaxID=63459 RepID=UPI000B78FA6C|nr:uncharacterized protein LOC110715191 [Chenopodium quinoa]
MKNKRSINSRASSIKFGDFPATEPPAPCRKNQKRKPTNTSSPAPPKCHTREKTAVTATAASGEFIFLLPPIHNDSLARARQIQMFFMFLLMLYADLLNSSYHTKFSTEIRNAEMEYSIEMELNPC